MPFTSIAKLLILTVVSFLPFAAHAYFPFVTDDTGTQGKGGNQLEFAYEFVKEHANQLNEDGVKIGTETGTANVWFASYTRGLTDDLDIFFGAARQTTPVNGWQNSEIGLKWVFAGDQGKGWSAALKPGVILPVSKSMQNSGLGNAETNWSLTLIGSYVHEDYEVHLNAGYSSNRYATTSTSESQRTNLWTISAAPVLVLNEQWKLGLDVGLTTNPGYNSRYQAFGGLGLVYAPVENLQIGLGAYATPAINSNDNGWGYTITTGLTFQF